MHIPEHAFKECTSLTFVDLSNLKTCGKYAFENCENLSKVILGPNFVQADNGNLTKLDSIETIIASSELKTNFASLGFVNGRVEFNDDLIAPQIKYNPIETYKKEFKNLLYEETDPTGHIDLDSVIEIFRLKHGNAVSKTKANEALDKALKEYLEK